MGFFDEALGGLSEQNNMGLLALAAALSPNSRMPRGLLQVGMMQAQNKREAEERAMRKQQFDMAQKKGMLELGAMERADAKERGLQDLQSQFFTPSMQGAGGTAAVDAALPPEMRIGAQAPIPARGPQFNIQGYTAAAMQRGYMSPIEAIKFQSSMQGEKPINKLDVKDFTPESVQRFTQTGNYADLVRMDKLHFADTGGAVTGMNPFTGQPVGGAPKTGNPYSDLLVGDGQGGMRPNSPLIDAKKSIAQAGAARTNVVVDAAPKAFWTDFGKSTSDQLFKERDGAQAAASTIQGIGEIRKAVQGGSYQGAGAELKLGAAKALNALGANFDQKTIANSEVFNSNAKQFVLNQIKMLGANPSNADREFIEKTVPSLSTDPGALPRMLDFLEGKARTQVSGFNSKIKNVQKQPGAQFMPFSLEVQEPPAAQTNPTATMRYNPQTGKLEPM